MQFYLLKPIPVSAMEVTAVQSKRKIMEIKDIKTSPKLQHNTLQDVKKKYNSLEEARN